MCLDYRPGKVRRAPPCMITDVKMDQCWQRNDFSQVISWDGDKTETRTRVSIFIQSYSHQWPVSSCWYHSVQEIHTNNNISSLKGWRKAKPIYVTWHSLIVLSLQCSILIDHAMIWIVTLINLYFTFIC